MEEKNVEISSRIAGLISGYLSNRLSVKEVQELENWINNSSANTTIFKRIMDEKSLEEQGKMLSNLDIETDLLATKAEMSFTAIAGDRKHLSLWPRFVAAASIILIVGAGLLFYLNQQQEKPLVHYANDVVPGMQGATLTLANGRKIKLTAASEGNLVNESGVSITKSSNGQLVYEIKDQATDQGNIFNTLTTAKGETYQVRLPDGTLIWLNAATSLKYPVSFTKLKTRNVVLSGEAYFEVAKDKAHPFVVESNGQQVQVLGTHFNVNAYTDEPSTNTTLLEGSIKVIAAGSAVVVKPGQQASFSDNRINIEAVNVNAVVDWKNGKFRFKNEPLSSILRKISRWYDVQIEYQTDPDNMPTFSGSVSRFDNVSAVLKMLEETSDVKFLIEGKTIKVQ
ncbi:FecR family protein [Pedobacter nyackensis]|uniref:FecR family protein n=1 Tax=Pedobacter nyackensis TaxID=475255 RepID=A0A1W2EKA0_9SPHI|nr:FecR domain-containing protein [Pedobacter nyackensis]SMD10140.1 FecR family protein [Pedobacter nyackensis]